LIIEQLAIIKSDNFDMERSMATLVSTNPSRNFEKIGQVDISSEDEIIQAVTNARQAQPAWQNLGIQGRIPFFQKFCELALTRKDDFSQMISDEMGKKLSDAQGEVDEMIESVYWLIGNAHEILKPIIVHEDSKGVVTQYREPFGVVAGITAWNYPASNFRECAMQDLIAGNTVVLKHSEETPMTGVIINEIMQEAQFPKGVYSQVYGAGEVGEILTSQDVDFISFIGSSAVGKSIYKKAADKFINVRLEMGGSSAGIIFDNSNIDLVVESVIAERFSNTGQICSALKRLLIHSSVYDEYVEKLKTKIFQLKVGGPRDADSDITSLVAERQVAPILRQINESAAKSATVICGGKRATNLDGAYIEPTLLIDVTADMAVWDEEVFGPVLPVMKFEDENEAIRIANNTNYGLNGFVYSNDKDQVTRVSKQLKCGAVETNGYSHGYRPSVPVGGYKLSGIGRTGGAPGLLTCTQVKVITEKK